MIVGILFGMFLGPIGFVFSDKSRASLMGTAIGWAIGWCILFGVGTTYVALRNSCDDAELRAERDRKDQEARQYKLSQEKRIRDREQHERCEVLVGRIYEMYQEINQVGDELNSIIDGHKYSDFGPADLKYRSVERHSKEAAPILNDKMTEEDLARLLDIAEKRLSVVVRRRKSVELLYAEKKAKIEASKKMCVKCAGAKKVLVKSKCVVCSGTGKVTGSISCKHCKGKGSCFYLRECSKCKGKGRCRSSCRECKGTGYVGCFECKGLGYYLAPGPYKEGLNGKNLSMRKVKWSCAHCNGRGKLACLHCSEVNCTVCNGRGNVERSVLCQICRGYGKCEGKFNCEKCAGGFIESWTECDECNGFGWIIPSD